MYVTAYTADDVQTINEIYFRGDYRINDDCATIVDFGSNIGISALYFLTRHKDSYCYCFEPLPQNVDRLRKNLSSFSDRYEVRAVAIGERDGQVRFGWEPTGRYGGIERDTGSWIEVTSVDSNVQLARIIERRGTIDILKIDIETLESIVTRRIPLDIAKHIKNVVVEYPFDDNPLAATHRMSRNNRVTTFRRI